MKSPFLVFRDFLSPKQCEEIIIGNNNSFPNIDKNGDVQPLYSGNKLSEIRIVPQLEEEVIPKIEEYYNVEVKGIKPFTMEWYASGYNGMREPRCENSVYINGEWKRSNDNDFTGIIFLNQYNEKYPFDNDFEVYGGKLEFPTHQFGFNPERGLLLIFPGAPNFMNATSEIVGGELTQIRFHIATHELYKYNRTEFPGDVNIWFKNELPKD